MINKLPSHIFLSIMNFFEKEYDFDAYFFLKQRNINKSDLQKDTSFSSISYLNELIDEVIEHTKDYDVLFKLAVLATPKNMGILGYMMLHSNNVCDALDKLCKYYILIGKSIKPVFVKIEGGYKIGLYSNDKKEGLLNLEKYKAQIHLFAILHLINNISNTKIQPLCLKLIQDKPYISKSNIKIEFNADENAIYFNEDIKNIKIKSSNTHLLKVFEKEAEETIKLKVIGENLKIKISALILVSTSELDMSLESIANKAKLHPRLLQKKLKAEGTTFSKILEEVRQKLSIYYLLKGVDISIISISLGYSELSSFFRAFKKWYFSSPKEWLLKNKAS